MFHAVYSSIPPVRVIAASISGAEGKKKKQRVTVVNYGSETVNLDAWSLSDENQNKHWPLSGTLKSGESITFSGMHKSKEGYFLELDSRRGSIVLNHSGQIVDKVHYQCQKKHEQGVPLTFLLDVKVSSDGFAMEGSINRDIDIGNAEVKEVSTRPARVPTGRPKNSELSADAHSTGLAIIAAMVDAEGNESRNGWCTIGNFSKNNIDLTGWKLSNVVASGLSPLALSGKIASGETVRINNLYNSSTRTGMQLHSLSGSMQITNSTGVVVHKVSYSREEHNVKKGLPVVFHADEGTAIDPVQIIAAQVNGDDRKNKWATVANFGCETVNLNRWTLSDTIRKPQKLDGKLKPGESVKIKCKSVQLGNSAGTLVLSYNGNEMDRVTYENQEEKNLAGFPLTFLPNHETSAEGIGTRFWNGRFLGITFVLFSWETVTRLDRR